MSADSTAPKPSPPESGASYPVTVVTSDQAQVQFTAAGDQDLVTAAAAAGYTLVSQCQQGSCGTCHARATGDYRVGTTHLQPTSTAQQQNVEVLLCQTFAAGPVQVQVGYPQSRLIEPKRPDRAGAIVSVTKVAQATVLVQIQLAPDPVTGAGFWFEPGQLVELSLPGDPRRRPYSLVGVSSWDGLIELVVRLRPGGYVSDFLVRALATVPTVVDRQVTVHGPTGAFGIRDSGLRPRWFVTGGTGIAPALSVVAHMLDWGEPHPVWVAIGVETPADLPQELLTRRLPPPVEVSTAVRSSTSAWDGQVGTAADLLAARLKNHAGTSPDIYVSGPPLLVEAVQDLCAQFAISPDQVLTERLVAAQ